MNFDETSPLVELLPLIMQIEDGDQKIHLLKLAGRSQRYLIEGKENMHDATIYLIKQEMGLK